MGELCAREHKENAKRHRFYTFSTYISPLSCYLSLPLLDWSESGLCINAQFENILLLKVGFSDSVCTVAHVYPKLSVQALTGLCLNGDY